MLTDERLDFYFDLIEQHYDYNSFDYCYDNDEDIVSHIHRINLPSSEITIEELELFLNTAEWDYVIDAHYDMTYKGYTLDEVNENIILKVYLDLTCDAMERYFND
jgi:hypothetical protein